MKRGQIDSRENQSDRYEANEVPYIKAKKSEKSGHKATVCNMHRLRGDEVAVARRNLTGHP